MAKTRYVLLLVGVSITLVLAAWAIRTAGTGKADDSGVDKLIVQPSSSAETSGSARRPVRIAVIGDLSVTGNSAGGIGDENWTQVLRKSFYDDGVEVIFDVSGHPGSGFVARGADKLTYGEAADQDVRTDDDIVIFLGSNRDVRQRPAALSKATPRAIDAARERAPKAKIIVAGMPLTLGNDRESSLATQRLLSVAAELESVDFIDPIAEGWFDDDRKRLLAKDGFSLRNAGHATIAKRFLSELKKPVERAARAKPLQADSARAANIYRKGVESLIDMGPSGAIVRAVRGKCSAGVTPYVEFSRDGKEGFISVPTPVSEIRSLSIDASGRISLVGLDDSCSTTTMASLEPGGFGWLTTLPSDEWYLSGAKGDVHAPEGVVRTGCSDVLSLSVVTVSIVRVGCANGTIRGSMDGGQSWKRLGTLPSMRTVGFSSPSIGIAFSAFEGCAAQSSTTRDGGNTWKRGACLAGERAESVIHSGDFWVAQISGVLYSSLDNGVTWGRYP